jgi:hypothetical protein
VAIIPGTPELTKRYFTPWLLRLFGKEPVLEQHQSVETEDGFDPKTMLVRVGALEECADGDSWRTKLDSLDTDTGRDELLDVDTGEVEYSEFSRAFVARLDGQTVGK